MMTTAPLPPGDFGPPLLGETLAFAKNPFDFFETRFRKHGPVFKTRILGSPMVCFVGPEALTFFTDEQHFERRDASPDGIQQLMHPLSLPFLDGEVHHTRRRMLEVAFSAEALASYLPAIERIVARFLARWAAAGSVSGTEQIGLLCFTFANALFAGADPDQDDLALRAAFNRFTAGLLALPIKLPFTTYGKALKARDQLRAYVARVVDDHKPGGTSSVLDRVLAARDEKGDPLPPAEVKIEILHFFAAAFAGLKATLMGLFMSLHANPALAARARDEVKGAVPAGPLTTEALARLSFNDLVSHEVRRYYRIFPSTFFGRVRSDVDHGGFHLPAGWKAIAVLHSTMFDEKVFSEPRKFDPERFGERGEHCKRPNSFVAHGLAPGHPCLGTGLAESLIRVFQALLLRDYTFELPAQDLTMAMAGAVPEPRSGLELVFRKA